MDIIFKEKYVNYNQISDVDLMKIYDVLIENDISLELGDDFSNDWAGYSYYYCKSLNDLDEKIISSFVYIITWFMTSNPININPNFKSETYLKNDKILNECLNIYNNIFDDFDSEIELCENLFKRIYQFYLNLPNEYIKPTERMNCILTYEEMKLFEEVDGKTRRDKIKTLLNKYYNQ